MSEAFADTNILVYAFSDGDKRDIAQATVARSDLISVQSLNEFANVAVRKLRKPWDDVGLALAVLRAHFPRIAPLDLATHGVGLDLVGRYRLAIYDAMIAAAALRGGCTTLWSEDLHDGLLIDGRLRVVNPFA